MTSMDVAELRDIAAWMRSSGRHDNAAYLERVAHFIEADPRTATDKDSLTDGVGVPDHKTFSRETPKDPAP